MSAFRHTAKRCARSSGMTIIEVVVWISIFTMAMVALTTSVLTFYRTSHYAIEESFATASAQQGIDHMVRRIREASYASNGAYPIVSIAPDDLVIYANVDSDSQIEEVHYYLSGNSLIEGITDPSGSPLSYSGTEATSSIADYVQNTSDNVSLFTYYDSSGNEITDYTKVGDVRFVKVNLVVDVDPNRAPTDLTLRSAAAIRNLVGR